MSKRLLGWLAERFRRLASGATGRRYLRRIFSWGVTYMSFAIPVKRLRESSSLLVFMHPHPTYKLHILLVPKRNISGFSALDVSDPGLLQDLVRMTQSLIQDFNLEQHGYRLIVNGGPNQDFPHLHFHLVSDHSPTPP